MLNPAEWVERKGVEQGRREGGMVVTTFEIPGAILSPAATPL